MPIFNYPESIYGALCYIYGNDDVVISSNEKIGMKSNFLKQQYLSNATMETISKRWSLNINEFYTDVIESLNSFSFTQRLEAYRTICIILNNFSKERTDRWDPAHKIKQAMSISDEEYQKYIDNLPKTNP